jgi:hypothetical protein
MKRHYILTSILLLGAAVLQSAGPKAETAAGPAAFARLKSLAGEWQADTPMGTAHLTYNVIAGGTALVERESAEKMPEMLTVYYLDGDRLLLTHYCMAGNQPRMEARAFNAETGEIRFQFLDATNLAPGGGHMHNATFHVSDSDHFSSAWEFFENGSSKRSESFQYTRVR